MTFTEWREAHPEAYAKRRERYVRWAIANPKQVREGQARWRAEHPKYSTQWAHANHESVRRSDAEWAKNHPEHMRQKAAARRALVAGNTVIRIIPSQIAAKWTYWGGLCWMCGEPATATDHVKPLAKSGAHMLCNLRPICKPCNSRKKARWPVDTSRRAR
jgi:5-methylcytosine-specific restriction endonuclease McrA